MPYFYLCLQLWLLWTFDTSRIMKNINIVIFYWNNKSDKTISNRNLSRVIKNPFVYWYSLTWIYYNHKKWEHTLAPSESSYNRYTYIHFLSNQLEQLVYDFIQSNIFTIGNMFEFSILHFYPDHLQCSTYSLHQSNHQLYHEPWSMFQVAHFVDVGRAFKFNIFQNKIVDPPSWNSSETLPRSILNCTFDKW